MHLVVGPSSFIFTFCTKRIPQRCSICPRLTHIEMGSSEFSKIPISVQVVISVREQQNRYQFKTHINTHLHSMCELITCEINLVISA